MPPTVIDAVAPISARHCGPVFNPAVFNAAVFNAAVFNAAVFNAAVFNAPVFNAPVELERTRTALRGPQQPRQTPTQARASPHGRLDANTRCTGEAPGQ